MICFVENLLGLRLYIYRTLTVDKAADNML